MKNRYVAFLSFIICATGIGAAHGATPLSQYGQIQNVQNYSSNPFWSPGQQYNKRIMPSPVYATGPDVETADCQRIVSSLVAVQCAALNQCTGKTVADIRPAVIQGLARLPGHNYSTACAGYIDSAFTSYKNQYANTVQPSAFPAATGTAPAQQQNNFKINNPFPAQVPQWANDVQERKTELEQLQAQNGAGSEHLTATAFPTTINDVSFENRMENLAAGYAPYKDARAYNGIKVESPEEALARQINILEQQRQLDVLQMSHEEYCDKYPLDAQNCPQTPGLYEQIANMGNATSQTTTQDTPQSNTAVSQAGNIVGNAIGTLMANATNNDNTSSSNSNNNTTAYLSPTDNKTHGGPCTPSAKSNWFPNKILTSGKYESIDPAFEKAMIQFFRMEGECGKLAGDKGGYTCYGFAQNYNPDIDVSKLTRPAAEDRTYERIYKAYGIDKLPDSVRGDVLRGWFGSGFYGVQQMQKVLNLPVTRTGRVDDKMVAAAENYNGDLHQAYWDQMQRYYISIAPQGSANANFLKGWMNSVKLMRENGCHVEPVQPLTR